MSRELGQPELTPVVYFKLYSVFRLNWTTFSSFIRVSAEETQALTVRLTVSIERRGLLTTNCQYREDENCSVKLFRGI